MNIPIDDLLLFCTYYSINKTAAALPHLFPPTRKAAKQSSLSPADRTPRKKIENVKPKRV